MFLRYLFVLVMAGVWAGDNRFVAAGGVRVVQYRIDEQLQGLKPKLQAQMKLVEENSCFRFQEVNGTAPVNFNSFSFGLCLASVHRNAGGIQIGLGYRYCNRPNVRDAEFLRAVMYSIGFVDEIFRSDRDEHIKLVPACLSFPHEVREYQKKKDTVIPAQAPGATPYDITSVMQPSSFSKGCCPYFLDKNLNAVRGRYGGLSDIDIERLQLICE